MPENKPPRPAYCVDFDEDTGKQVRGTRRIATKEKPKVSQPDDRLVKMKKPHSNSGDKSSQYAQALEVMQEEARLERRKSVSTSVKSPRKAPRPPLTHENRTSTSGKLSVPSQRSPRDVPSNYGISPYAPPSASTQAPMAIPLRPRAVTTQTYPNRPPSYHQPFTSNGAHGPPLSMSAYYQPQPIVTPSYPPPSANNSYMRYAATPTNPQVGDYFAQHMTQPPPRPLSARFDAIPRTHLIEPITRTASAFGTRDTRRQSMDGQYDEGYYEDSYASRVSDPSVRRREIMRVPAVRPREDPDALAMPPPPLPQPRPILRRPMTTDYASEADTRTEYSDRSERPERPERHERHERHDRQIERRERPEFREPSRTRRPSTNRHSVSYDLGKDSERVRVETANNGRRRQSYYGQSTSTGASSAYEDKINSAATYQEEIAGPTIPLTTDMLKKQQRRAGGSSNSGSRDESDYKKSATTRTTRSGSGNDDENVTIKVTGQARVMVGGTQIDCTEGGEISILRQKSLRNGSERGSEYSAIPQQRQIDDRRSEDRRSRVDRPSGRTRISSSHSYTRSTPQSQYQVDYI